jgi:hypothetical protein
MTPSTDLTPSIREIFNRVDGKIPDAEPLARAINMEMIAKRLREKRNQRRARERLQDPIGRDVHGDPVEP